MPIKQGLNFRNTAGYVTDGTDHTYEIGIGPTVTYPRTTPQGFNVGWEVVGSGGPQTRNRSTSIDTRLAGTCFNTTSTEVLTYRIDLPNAGSHDIRIAAGDNSYARSGFKIELFDDTTSLGILVANGTTAGGKFRDATDAELTAAAWPAGNTKVTKTFASQIARFKLGNGTNQTYLAHLYIEGVAAGGAALATNISGNTTLTADLTVAKPLAVNIVGNTTVTASLSGSGASLASNIIGNTTVTADLTVAKPLATNIAGNTTVTANLTVAKPLAANITGNATVTADLTASPAGLAVSIFGNTTVTADLTVAKPLAVLITGNTTLTADLTTAAQSLATNITGNTTLTANLTVAKPLAVNVVGNTVVTADLTALPASLQVNITGNTTVTANLTVPNNTSLATNIKGQATLVATLTGGTASTVGYVMTREVIYSALFDKLTNAANFKTKARRLRHWADVNRHEQPALFLIQKRETAQPVRGQPTKWLLSVDVYIYAWAAPPDLPSQALNPLLDAITAAIAPDRPQIENVQTLGGLAHHCWIEGGIETDEGVLGDQSVAIIPINILAT